MEPRPRFLPMDTVRHLPDYNWWPFSSVNRVCKVLRVFNGYCYDIVPIDGVELHGMRDNEIVYCCRDQDLEPVET